MSTKMNLGDLKAGDSAKIVSVGGEGALRQHFLDMGLIKDHFNLMNLLREMYNKKYRKF